MKKFFALSLVIFLFISFFTTMIYSGEKEKEICTPTFDERWPEDLRSELTPVARLSITGSVPITTTSTN
jgi:hypothetical protein